MPAVKYRAQVWNGTRWVDGVLAVHRDTAQHDAERLARRYHRPSRVLDIPSPEETTP